VLVDVVMVDAANVTKWFQPLGLIKDSTCIWIETIWTLIQINQRFNQMEENKLLDSTEMKEKKKLIQDQPS